MTLGSKLMARLSKLPPAQTTDISVEPDIAVKMPDGTVLLTDRWYPTSSPAGPPPVIVIRTPYGRRRDGANGRLFAERGYQVVVQSCRGTFGSTGEWDPFRNERADGLATLEWVSAQPWFSGTALTLGGSYVGLTQWAVSEGAPDWVKASCLAVTASNFRDTVTYPGGSFALETVLAWVYQVGNQEAGLAALPKLLLSPWRLKKGFATLPLAAADRAVSATTSFYQDWLEHNEPGDPWWEPVDFSPGIATMPAPLLTAGWYDIFLPAQLADYAALRDAGRQPRVVIGPWSHVSPGLAGATNREALEWFDAHTGHARHARRLPGRHPVRLFVMGAKRWVDLPDWPPPADVQRWYLHAGGRLDRAEPAGSGSDRYRYDPADPTPSLGGASLAFWNSGRKDNKRRESRTDVLCYTSDVLSRDVTVAGNVAVDLRLRSTVDHTDVFVRLCDVDPKGRSRNVCDGILRLRPEDIRRDADGIFGVRVDMWPTAMTFRKGHRIRVQVSSGAHPLYARNTGSGEPLATAARIVPSEHEVARPSAIELPVAEL